MICGYAYNLQIPACRELFGTNSSLLDIHIERRKKDIKRTDKTVVQIQCSGLVFKQTNSKKYNWRNLSTEFLMIFSNYHDEGIQIANRSMESCSALVIREI